MGVLNFTGHGANVVGSLGSGSLVQNMPPALQYNGTSTNFETNINISSSLGANNSTFSAWFRSEEGSGDGTILSGYVGSDPSRWDLWVDGDNSRIRFVEHDGNNDINYTFANNDTAWHQVTLTNDVTANTATLYFDGVLAGSCSVPNDLTTDGELQAGDGGGAGGFLSGSIRDVRMYNTELSVTQVPELFAGTFSDTTNLLIHYDLEDPTDTTPANQGSVSANGTVSNGAWDYSEYNLNQIGLGSVSGSATVSGGAWSLKNSSYIRPTGTNNTNANYIELNNDQQYDGSRSYAMWFYLSDTGSTQVILDNYLSNLGTQVFINGGTPNLYLRLNNTNVFNFAANVNEWNHLVWTIDETNNLAKGYLNSTEVTSVANNRTYGTVSNMRLGSNVADTYPTNDGNYFSEYAYYTSVLTPTQIDLLFKGQWIGSPETWLKMDEGTGTSITNHGTDGATATLTGVSSNIPAWVNPTYDLNGRLTITADGTVSAPKGDFDIDENFQNYGTFTHNSGTVVFTAGDNSFINTEGTVDPVFYNVTSEKHQLRFYNDVTIERQLQLDAAASHCYIWANKTLTMGSTTNPETGYPKLINNMNDGDKQFWFYAGDGQTSTLQGVSKLYPIIFTKAQASADIEWGYHANAAAQIKNIDFQFDIETDTTDTTDSIKLTGDCEFDKLTISNGDRINLNGQRAKFSGNLDMESGVTFVGSGALLICDDKIKTDGASVYNSGTSVICGHAGTSTIRFSEGDWENLMYNPTGGGVCFDTNANVANNLIVAGGYYDMQATHLSGDGVGKLQIVGGGEFRGGDGVTHKITDTFNLAGGFIGQGAIDVTGVTDVSAQYMTAAGFTGLVGASAATIECWFRASDSNPESAGLVSLFPAAEWNINVNRSGSDLHLGWEWENDGTEIFKSNGPLLGPSNAQKWHHAVMTIHDTNGYEIYLDGKLEATGASLGNTADVSEVALTVGSSFYSTNYLKRGFSGAIARASVWNVVLTESEIRSMMFQDWTTMAGADVVDDSKCVAWYEFGDSQGALSITDKSGNGNTGTLSADVWSAPGTFTYETSTLKFDKAGTCNLIGHQDASATNMYSVHITNGTTVDASCRDNDLVMNSGSLMTNSGTLTSNRNWQYRSRNMPIVGPTSDLKVSTNIWYYMGDGSGLPVSGAGTNYYQLRPSSDVWMQGDFDCSNGLLQSGGDLHLNGHTCSTSKIWNYGGGNIHAEPGSSIVFDTEYGFNTSYGENPTTMFFVASGEAAYQATTDAAGTNTEGVYTNTEVVTSGTSQMSVSYWVQIPSDSNFWDTSLLRCVWGFGSIFTGEPTVASHPGMWGHTIQSSYIKNDFYSYDNPADADDDFSRIHESFTQPINWTGTGPYGWHHICTTVAAGTAADTLKTYVDGVEVDSRQKPKEFLIVGNGSPGLSVHGGHLQDSKSSYGTQMSIADFRIYKDITLTSGNTVTLASENPATSVSGAYADPTNTLGATLWWKLNDNNGILDTTDSVGTNNGTGYGGAKSGFVTISGSVTPYNPINNLYPAGVTLQNTYISGSKDIIVGQRKENSAGFMAVPSQTLTTKGTVTLE